jgi:class 3 adenylate cyclase
VGLATRYAKNGDIYIVYETLGDGPIDLVWVQGSITNLDIMWEEPRYRRFCERLAAFSRLIRFDKRGMGLSDRVAVGTLEDRMDDVRAVLDAVGSERAAVLGVSEGGPMSILFAATYPERTVALLLYGAEVREEIDDEWQWGDMRRDEVEAYLAAIPGRWGQARNIESLDPTTANEGWLRQWFGRLQAQSISPGGYVDYYRTTFEIDVRDVLPTVRVPTFVLHRREDHTLAVDNGRYIAAHIPGARYIELPGKDHIPWLSEADDVINEVQEFLTGSRGAAEPDRVLMTVLFTDIVGSTQRAAALGDRRWQDLLENHNALVRQELGRFRGREVGNVGDGFLATFDGPARAVRCAGAITSGARDLGIEVRTGLHTGEIELAGDDIRGIAVHIGARVSSLAGPGEVLVSGTVRDLVAGSGIEFEDRGMHSLKGVPGEWRIFAAQT